MQIINYGEEFSHIENYTTYAKQAILEMCRQVGEPTFSKDGILTKGVLIRHLILPNNVNNTKKVIDWLECNVKDKAVISIMAQYFPCHKATNIQVLNRGITKREYKKVENYLYEKNFRYGYIQDMRKTRRNICTKVLINFKQYYINYNIKYIKNQIIYIIN